MGQTLTHGIYLPDEGERNCYNGLAANWSILDGAVGAIAEHTTALAGKAPLVHTHTKSDITDFPVYGTTAGTICEGNDSRLSDARTPVAHTHTKSDVTDLFNSANTWTGINTYTTALRFSAADYSAGTPSSDIFYGSVQWGGIVNNTFVQSFGINNAIRTTGINDISLRVWSQTGSTLRGVAVETNADASNSSFRPLVNNVTNLGSTVYQWNNLYAKNYYYNGVAWGLDKNNTWTQTNYFTKDLIINSEAAANTQSALSGGKIRQIIFNDSNNSNYFFRFRQYVDASSSRMQFNAQGFDSNNQAYSATFVYRVNSDGSSVLYPGDNNQSLGTSTNKWKSFNGLNPGALSFPNYDDTTYIDISGSIVPPSGETEINKNLGHNEYTPPIDGWLSIRCDGATFLQIYRNSYNCPGITSCDPSGGKLVVTLPVRKNVTYTIRIKTSGTTNIYQLYPCQGNV